MFTLVLIIMGLPTFTCFWTIKKNKCIMDLFGRETVFYCIMYFVFETNVIYGFHSSIVEDSFCLSKFDETMPFAACFVLLSPSFQFCSETSPSDLKPGTELTLCYEWMDNKKDSMRLFHMNVYLEFRRIWNERERERENKQYSLIVYSACSSISLINYIHFLMHSFHPLYFRERETIMNYIYFLTSISRSDPHYFRERDRA